MIDEIKELRERLDNLGSYLQLDAKRRGGIVTRC